jgi:nitrate/TMAO reductase-like tetraheme cytochrome c subunit
MSKKRIVVFAVLLVVVVIGGVGAIGLWQYHERPEFCAACHIMQPYLDSWQQSDYGAHAHAAQDVTCLECHVPTTQQQVDELLVYVQGDFTVPLAEREYGNDFCFDCHESNEHTSYDEVAQLTSGLELNPHSSHLVGQIDCNLCHKMHDPSADYCAYCHEPVATGAGWTVPVSLTAEIDIWEPDMDCTVCHVMDPYVESLDNPDLLAYAHAQEELECLDCHTDVEELRQVHEEAVPGKRIVGMTVDNEFCFDCHVPNEHTSYEQVIEETEGYIIEGQEINPHDPHPNAETVKPIECSTCHQMHEESPLINACYSCHHSGTLENCSVCHD